MESLSRRLWSLSSYIKHQHYWDQDHAGRKPRVSVPWATEERNCWCIFWCLCSRSSSPCFVWGNTCLANAFPLQNHVPSCCQQRKTQYGTSSEKYPEYMHQMFRWHIHTTRSKLCSHGTVTSYHVANSLSFGTSHSVSEFINQSPFLI